MCHKVFNVSPKQLFFQCSLETPKVWTPLIRAMWQAGTACDQRTPLILLYFAKTNWGRMGTQLVWPTGSLRGPAPQHAESPAPTQACTRDNHPMCFPHNIGKPFLLKALLSSALLGYNYSAIVAAFAVLSERSGPLTASVPRTEAEPGCHGEVWAGWPLVFVLFFCFTRLCPLEDSTRGRPPSPAHSGQWPFVWLPRPWVHPLNKSCHGSGPLLFCFVLNQRGFVQSEH